MSQNSPRVGAAASRVTVALSVVSHTMSDVSGTLHAASLHASHAAARLHAVTLDRRAKPRVAAALFLSLVLSLVPARPPLGFGV